MQVEPFNRALAELEVDVMINGRRRDHGFDRAQLEARGPYGLHATLRVYVVVSRQPAQ